MGSFTDLAKVFKNAGLTRKALLTFERGADTPAAGAAAGTAREASLFGGLKTPLAAGAVVAGGALAADAYEDKRSAAAEAPSATDVFDK